jgi:hypothetical protein
MEKTKFEEWVKKTRMQDRAIRLAKMILVDGMKPKEAGKAEGVTRQLAEQAVNRVLRQIRMEENYPNDWRSVVSVLPETMAQAVEYIQSKEQERAGLLVKAKPHVPDFTAKDIELLTDMIAAWRKK